MSDTPTPTPTNLEIAERVLMAALSEVQSMQGETPTPTPTEDAPTDDETPAEEPPTRAHYLEAQVVDDEADPSDGTGHYAAGVNIYSQFGRTLGRMAADTLHNHLGFYTRKHGIDKSSGKMLKRLNIDGGETVEKDGDVLGNTELRLFSEYDTRFRVSSSNGGVPSVEFVNDGRVGAAFEYDRSQHKLLLVNKATKQVIDDWQME